MTGTTASLPLSETTLQSHPDGARVRVTFEGHLDGYADHYAQRRVAVRFPLADGVGEGTVLLPPNAEIEILELPCTCSKSHRTKMAKYGQPHAKRCPQRDLETS